MATKTSDTASALAEASAAHLSNLLSLREQAMDTCSEQSVAVDTANTARDEAVLAANQSLAGAIGEVAIIDTQLSALGHDGELASAPRMPRGFGTSQSKGSGATRASGRKSRGRSTRGSNSAGLNDSVLMALNLAPDESWKIADVAENLGVVGWDSKATADNLNVQISTALSGLLASRFITRPSRGVYTITASGIKHAESVAAEIEAADSE